MFKIFRKNCCGLDVHKIWIYVCIGITDVNGLTEYKQVRFSSFSKDLRDLATWLAKYSWKFVWNPPVNTGFRYRRCKTPVEEIQAAVDGVISPKQAVKLRHFLAHIDELETHRNEIEQEILLIAEPFFAVLNLLYTRPGLDKNPMTAIAILFEIVPHMLVFPLSKNLVSRAGYCPHNDQSTSKVKSTRISRAGCYLKPLLVPADNALIKSKKHPEFKERYHRIKTHRGHKKTIIAVCKLLLTAIRNMLSKMEPYNPDGFLKRRTVNEKKVLTKSQALELFRLRGYTITDD